MDDPANIKRITDVFVSDLTIKRVRGDAINGYGVSTIYIVLLSIRDSRCRLCDQWAIRTPTNEQMMPTNPNCHRWMQDWHVLAEAQAPTQDEAFQLADAKAKIFADEILS